MAAEAKQLVNVPVFGEDNLLFGDVNIEDLSDERIAELVDFWGVEIGEGQDAGEAIGLFFEGLLEDLQGENAAQTRDIVRKAIVTEAEFEKPLEKYTNAQIMAFLDLAHVEYETDANKATLCALLRNGSIETAAADHAAGQEAVTHEPKMVSVFSHYEAAGRIKDNGKVYNAGDEYAGENSDNLLAAGALRAVYVEKSEDEMPGDNA